MQRESKSMSTSEIKRHRDARIPKTVGVVGLGLMGSSIAARFAHHGFRVIGYDTRREAARRSVRSVREALWDLKRSEFRTLPVDKLLRQYSTATSISDLSCCQFIVEAILEEEKAKRQLIANLEYILSPDAVIATNTSSIPISALQSRAKHPERIIGMHWAEPAHITRFLEIICGRRTNVATRDRTVRLAARCGKEPAVLRKDIRGFITNRVFYAMLREAFHLVESGVATVEDVDRSLRNDLGWWITLAGPFRYMDLTGLPAYGLVMKGNGPELSNRRSISPCMRKLMRQDPKRVADGRGFYSYTPAEARAWQRKFIRFSHDIRR